MIKRFSLILTLTMFLGMQFFTVLHISEQGSHDHNGQACDVCLRADHNKLLSVDDFGFEVPSYFTANFKVNIKTFTSVSFQSFNSRDPPFIS